MVDERERFGIYRVKPDKGALIYDEIATCDSEEGAWEAIATLGPEGEFEGGFATVVDHAEENVESFSRSVRVPVPA